MWLLCKRAPDFKTIADFRRDNGPAIIGACRAFVLLCRDAGVFAARLVALDGAKFRAVASRKKGMGRREIAEEAARLDDEGRTSLVEGEEDARAGAGWRASSSTARPVRSPAPRRTALAAR